MQTGLPTVLSLLWTCLGGRDLERALHERFAPHRVRGEWFDLTPIGDPVEVVRAAVAEIQDSARTALLEDPERPVPVSPDMPIPTRARALGDEESREYGLPLGTVVQFTDLPDGSFRREIIPGDGRPTSAYFLEALRFDQEIY
jgi:hypothetical protein